MPRIWWCSHPARSEAGTVFTGRGPGQDTGVRLQLRTHRAMSDALRARMALAAGAVVLLLAIAGGVLQVLNGSPPDPWLFAALGIAAAGVVVAVRRPRNPVGWLFIGAGATLTISHTAAQYAIHAVYAAPGSLPAPLVAGWFGSWTFILMVPLMTVFLPLLFPNGELPSNRLRIPVWIMIGLAVALAVCAAIPPINIATHIQDDGSLYGSQMSESGSGPIWKLTHVLLVANMLAAVVAIASLVVRFVRSRGDEREQLKWFLFAAAMLVTVLLVTPFTSGKNSGPLSGAIANLLLLAIVGVPVATAVAILRYRLYDIDVVISRTLVYGSLAAFITAVYIGIVVGIGALIGSGGRPSIALSIIATAIVAVAFQPVRERVQKVANRLVYGKRATPYEVLSQFSERVAESYAADDVLPRMARVLADGTGAARADVWLRAGDLLRQAASWPTDSADVEPSRVIGDALPERLEADRAVEVRHQGELLGALTVTKRKGESLTPVEEKLLTDLAGQAGLVLKNVGLTAELLARLEDLRASRQRLVAAQDEERRRLERNLHDGAQQNLVALKVKLGLAEMFAEKDPARAKQTLAELKVDADEALETLRDLARGIYPPLLADKGLVAALESQARKATLPVQVDADGVGRYPQELEAAVYFCCLEALQNVQKYAAAHLAVVKLDGSGSELSFEVTDDGRGFDGDSVTRGAGLTNMTDRIDALGGRLEVSSTPERGTRVHGSLPALVAVAPA
jgi:signal transduction histidine kinase